MHIKKLLFKFDGTTMHCTKDMQERLNAEQNKHKVDSGETEVAFNVVV